jgi:hypothetical protein
MSNKKPKIGKRLDKLFEEINTAGEQAKPKAPPRAARETTRQTTSLKAVASTRGTGSRKPSDSRTATKSESIKTFDG